MLPLRPSTGNAADRSQNRPELRPARILNYYCGYPCTRA